MSSRIRTTTTGAPVKRFPTEFHVFMDPISRGATVVFQGEEFLLNADGSAADKLEGRQALTTSAAAIGEKTFHAGKDPVTGADLSLLSLGGVLQYLDAFFGALHQAEHAPEG